MDLLSAEIQLTRLNEVIKCKDFGSLNRLLSVTSVVVKFCQLLDKLHPEATNHLQDMNFKAEQLWIMDA